MSDPTTPSAEQPIDRGAIVLKARTAAAVTELAKQLEWLAMFGDAFHNRYEGGFAIKGQVRAVPGPDAPDHAGLTAKIVEQAALIGDLQDQVARLQRELAGANERAAFYKKWMNLLQPDEHARLISRNVGLDRGAIVEATVGGERLQLFARDPVERIARAIEEDGPDNPIVSLRAADACAAIARAFGTQGSSPSP